jgi:lactoylglutathione lyase
MGLSLEHAAIWVRDLEMMRRFYESALGGRAGSRYVNPATGFSSYFISFGSGARLELMARPDIPANRNDVKNEQHLGLIHLAFDAGSRASVDAFAALFAEKGYEVLRGPRVTGDGYYEFEALDPEGNRIEIFAQPEPV